MYALILSVNPNSLATSRLSQELIRRDHQVKVYTFHSSEIRSENHPPKELQGRPFEMVFPRLGNRGRLVADHFLTEMEDLGVPCLNDYSSMRATFNKYSMYKSLSQKGLPLPRTWIAKGSEGFREVWREYDRRSLVIKGLRGAHGNSIFLSPHPEAADKILNLPEFVGTEYLIQEFIPETLGRSVSALVIGGELVAAIQLSSSNADESSNISVGRKFGSTELSIEERNLVLKAANMMNLDVAEVELARSSKGPIILEVNSSPGFERYEASHKQNIAELIIEHSERIHYTALANDLRVGYRPRLQATRAHA